MHKNQIDKFIENIFFYDNILSRSDRDMLQIALNVIQLINILTVIYIIFKEKRTPNEIIAWTVILFTFPFIGFLIFLLIGRKIGNSNMFGVKKEESRILERYLKYTRREAKVKSKQKIISNYDMIRSLSKLDYSPYTDDNKIDVYVDGKEFFEEMIKTILSAKKSINIQFYIFKNDEIGSRILDALTKKAADGIDIRFLYDSVGSRGINKKVLEPFKAAGGKTGEFFPSWLKVINLKMNFRNHRKMVIIDNKVGFLGGFNVGDEYLGKDKKFGYWRDTAIKFEGSAVKDLSLRFLADWRYATKEDIHLDSVLLEGGDLYKAGNESMQILSSGPNEANKFEIKLGYLKMIQKAQKYIYIQSPYLILDNSISDALKLAALSGVDVKIMIPGKGDHPFVFWANLFYAGELIEYGVQIYHYDKDAFLHAKTVVMDDEISSVGTANMDTRSFELNFEVNSFIYSEAVSKKLKEAFEDDLLKSTLLTVEKYNSRGNIVKIKEIFSKLFSSLL